MFACLLILSSMLVSCIGNEDENTSAPKPRAFYRLTFPEKKYKVYESDCPFTFEIPVYSSIETDKSKNTEPCWINLVYPLYKAQLHISYKEVLHNLPQYLDDSRELAIRHQVKASGLEEQVILNKKEKVYGLLYEIAGNSASSVQFYVTDSTHHFLRGSLYFDCPPNIDSLKIVIDFLHKDVEHLIETFKWKNENP